MPEVYFVRANYGQYAEQFLKGGYVAIGWLEETDLKNVQSRDEIWNHYVSYHTADTSTYVIGQQVGQIARFMFDIKPGDYVLTAPANTEYINWGIVEKNPYFYGGTEDGCPYPHRKKVKWHSEPVRRAEFSVPFQNTIRSSLTVFWISHKANFFEVIGKSELLPKGEYAGEESYYDLILNRILSLDPTEFEILITHLLTALGFEAQHTGKSRDGGIDARGELDIANMAKIKLYVQAKRFKLDSKINPKLIKDLRANVPTDAQGAFITTCDFHKSSLEIAVQPGFPRIGTINGKQLVDILSDNWDKIPKDFQEKLGLKKGLILS